MLGDLPPRLVVPSDEVTFGFEEQLKLADVIGAPVKLYGWRDAEPAVWLVRGFLQRSAVTLISAGGGRGKSLLIHDMIFHGAAPAPAWLDIELPASPLHVAVIEAENGINRLRRRTGELVAGGAFPAEVADLAAQNIDFFPADGLRDRGRVLSALPLLLSFKQYDLLVLDPLRSFLPDTASDENDNVLIGKLLDFLVALAKRFKVAILVVDHDSKSGMAARGASSKQDAAEMVAHLTAPDADDPNYLLLTMTKQRDPGGSPRIGIQRVTSPMTPEGLCPVRFERVELRDASSKGPELPSKSDAVLNVLRDNAGRKFTARTLSEIAGCHPATAKRALYEANVPREPDPNDPRGFVYFMHEGDGGRP